jgi:hypothetical protein
MVFLILKTIHLIRLRFMQRAMENDLSPCAPNLSSEEIQSIHALVGKLARIINLADERVKKHQPGSAVLAVNFLLFGSLLPAEQRQVHLAQSQLIIPNIEARIGWTGIAINVAVHTRIQSSIQRSTTY